MTLCKELSEILPSAAEGTQGRTVQQAPASGPHAAGRVSPQGPTPTRGPGGASANGTGHLSSGTNAGDWLCTGPVGKRPCLTRGRD